MPRAWYASDRARVTLRRLAVFGAVILAYGLLSMIPFMSHVNGWLRHQLVWAGTGVGGAIARLVQSEESSTAQLAMCQDSLRSVAVDYAHLADVERLLAESNALLDYQMSSGAAGQIGRILSRSIESSATVLIDQGSEEGVVEGMAAVIGEGILYGMVTEVFEDTAVVRLTTDRESSIPTTILGRHRVMGLAEGQEGALLAMEYIPQDVDISVGQIVVTNGLDNLVPAGLVIGTITDVAMQDSAPFKRALVEPLHDPREWTVLMLLVIPGSSL